MANKAMDLEASILPSDIIRQAVGWTTTTTTSTSEMTWELNRSRCLRTLNTRFIYGTVPLLHAVIFCIEMALFARLTSRFNGYYEERPILTMMVSNAILGGIADTVAQSITAIRQRAVRKHPYGLDAREDALAIEIHELDRKNPLSDRDLIPDSKALPPPFDFERLARFMAYGFCMAPIQFRWFKFLESTFPLTKANAFIPTMKRVACDQLVFAPFGVAAFFTAMTLAEGGDTKAVSQKLKDMYFPTLKANYILWPAVQVVNFRLMPVQFQLPFVSTVGIAWTAYLSLTNAAENVQQGKPRAMEMESLPR
ncbi:hypothetical protein B0T21DRAFT_371236 [Apiosordaria backusii]|uniref:Vacuolar membrane protein n=1 Tax=Apiosordaria backusii TaxID=314023 RepID=A0AA40B226_9PEZI|nr:hypothetical protein B0T21DRAFT_371236 [Apiosordaria backusii]